MTMRKYHVYILTNFARTTFYIGLTGHLCRRMTQHRLGQGSEFCMRYNLKHLVYVEEFSDIREAIKREKQLKHWHRQWKIELIQKVNPNFEDLSCSLLADD